MVPLKDSCGVESGDLPAGDWKKISVYTQQKMANLFYLENIRQPKEKDWLHHSYAVPKIKWIQQN